MRQFVIYLIIYSQISQRQLLVIKKLLNTVEYFLLKRRMLKIIY